MKSGKICYHLLSKSLKAEPEKGIEGMGDLLVRDVPEQIRSWIEQLRNEHNMTQQELVLSLLKRACDNGSQPTLPFEPVMVAPSLVGRIPFSFIDLFAGIGGYRIPLQSIGGSCVFSSEIDKYSQKTYKAWFGDTPKGDITQIKPADIPDHDILAAGFPCQPFSIAGVSKKKSLGHAHGFLCQIQGTLFFNVASIIEVKRPPIVLLENVKNLKSHDQGTTWKVINESLEELGYKVFSEVIDAAHWVPQHRERIYIVCFDKQVFGDNPPFEFPKPPQSERPKLKDILEPDPDKKYTLTDHLWKYLQDYADRHKAKGNGFGFGLADLNGTTRTLSARYHKDGSEILIPQGKGKNPRRLTPKECARLMGFPKEYQENIVVSDTQAYRQFGNAIVPIVAEAVVRQVMTTFCWQLTRENNGCLLKCSATA
jgi:DNA (cytosine-5)-methyltransferase 1